MRKAVKIIMSSFMYLIIGIFTLYLISSLIGMVSKKPATLFGYGHAVVVTGSMEPTIETGSFIIIKKSSFDDIKVGDIIVYKSRTDSKNIVHRVVSIENGIITQGDNKETNKNTDFITQGYITEDRYLGTVISYGFSFLGKHLINAQSTLILLAVLLLGILLVIQMVSLVKESKKKEEQKHQDELERLRKELEESVEKDE